VACFADTSVWYSAARIADRDNVRAKKLLQSSGELVTSDYVVLETWRLLHHKAGWQKAENFWAGIRRGVAATESVLTADMELAFTIGKEFPDQEFALTDRTSFAVMLRLGITKVATFDSDFAVFRYGARKSNSFEIVG
jgi:uncharacterized protein